MNIRKVTLVSITLVAALAAAGCGGGGGMSETANTPTPPSPPVGEGFTSWSKSSVFAQPEDSQPVIMDSLVFRFDGDDDLNAYTDLIPLT